MIKLGECEERCIQEVTRYRFCVDPPPARRKDKCAGQAVLKTTRVCKRGDCGKLIFTLTKLKGRKEGNVLFNDALNTFLCTVIWFRTYGNEPFR